MATLVRTGAQIQLTSKIVATVANKVWTCEGDVDPRLLRGAERMLQAHVKEDTPCGPIPSGAIDNDLAKAAAARHGVAILYMDERPDNAPQYLEDGTIRVY